MAARGGEFELQSDKCGLMDGRLPTKVTLDLVKLGGGGDFYLTAAK